MIPTSILMYIIWMHFIGDFVLQSTKVATNKYKDSKVLMKHCILYAFPFVFIGVKYALIAGFLHFPIDYVTSKLTHKLYDNNEYHWFFVVIGLDQAIHMTILLKTFLYLYG